MFRESGSLFAIEPIERRILFTTTWGPTAALVNQDDAANIYSSITGKGVYVAVIDSGINYSLPALGGGFGAGFKVAGGHDFVDDDSDPMDTDGHGTEVAGVIAANPFDFNGKHYSGVAPDATLVALRVTHGTDGAADATIEQALKWVINNQQTFPVSIVNISLGSGSYGTAQSNSTLSDEFATLAAMDVSVFAASGNDGANGGIAYPAADPNVISVGAVNSGNAISSFTQRSTNLDLLAPGEDVPTTARTGGFASVDGTSFASPYAAGTAALVHQANPNVGSAALLSILRGSGPANFDGDNESGTVTSQSYPRIDIYYALRLTTQRRTSAANVVGTLSGTANIAYDQSRILHLVYYDGVAHTIKYATRDTRGFWSKTTIVDTSGADVGVYLSIKVDPTGKPGIAYFDNTNADLKYAHFNGVSWEVWKLDGDKNVGSFPSLAYDNANNPVIAYYRKSGGDLRLMTIANGAWTRQTLDSTGDVGAWASVAAVVTGGEQIIAVSYVDLTNGDLKYDRFLQGAWTIFDVDNLNGVGYTSLNIHNGQAFISYQDLQNGDLKFAIRANSTWTSETVYTPGSTGQFTSLVFDSNDQAHIAFWSKSKNFIYQAVGTFGSWSVKKVANGGAWTSAAATDDGDVLSFAALDITKRNLQFGNLT